MCLASTCASHGVGSNQFSSDEHGMAAKKENSKPAKENASIVGGLQHRSAFCLCLRNSSVEPQLPIHVEVHIRKDA